MNEQYILYGYRIRNGQITIERKEAKLVHRIFDEIIAGITCCQLAKKFNVENVDTLRNAKQWTHGAIAKIIRNEDYTGIRYYPEIINKKDFKLANEKMKFISKKELNGNHPLYKIVKCAQCGRSYRRYQKGTHYIWCCPTMMCHMEKHGVKEGIDEDSLVQRIINVENKLIGNLNLIEMNQQTVEFRLEPQYRKATHELDRKLRKGTHIDDLLALLQEKTMIEYEGFNVIDYEYKYKKVYDYLYEKSTIKKLDVNFLNDCVKEICVDADEKVIYIQLINNQTIEKRWR